MSGKRTRNSWTDTIGQTFQVGDYIAVASTHGRSAQMVIARVESINTHTTSGEEITEYAGWDPEARRQIRKPSVTVTAKPVLDGRGFHRWSATKYEDGKIVKNPKGPRSVTYTIPGNILKVTGVTADYLAEKLAQS